MGHDAESISAPASRSNSPSPYRQAAPLVRAPVAVSSSPVRLEWELDPAHTSTPQRLETRLSPAASRTARSDALEDEAAPKSEMYRPEPSLPKRTPSLADLDKRRRSSLAPSSQQSTSLAKKIRREYDTTKSTAVPHLRAYKDTYDEYGNRIWVPHRPEMKRAPEEAIAKVAGDDSKLLSLALDEQNVFEHQEEPVRPQVHVTPAAETTSTVISETPQAPRTHNLFDISSDPRHIPEIRANPELLAEPSAIVDPTQATGPSQRVSSEPPRSSPALLNGTSEANATHGPSQPIAYASQGSKKDSTPATKHISPAPSSSASPVIRLGNKGRDRRPSRLRQHRQSLQITPAPPATLGNRRTRLSTGANGVEILYANKDDRRILMRNGLQPTLKRLGKAHGFTVEVVLGVYEEVGSLEETEATLKEMKQTAAQAKANRVRRMSYAGSSIGVVHGEEIPLESSDGEMQEEEGDFHDWDTSRTRSRLMFEARAP